MTFGDFNLRKQLLITLADLGYVTPTTIQGKVFPVIMSGADVCGIAQTGTGKTLAYLLPLLNQWKYAKEKNPQILVIVPTRELVVQIVAYIKKLTTNLSFEVVGVYGGANINTQKLEMLKGMDALVATPGRLYDLAVAGAFKMKSIKKLVIDEFDEMLNHGFRTQLRNILDLLPASRQNLLFSATRNEEVDSLLEIYFNDPVKIEAAPAGTPVENIDHLAYEVPNFYTKVNLLQQLLAADDTMQKVLVFVSSKKMADQLYELMENSYKGTAGVIHSNKEQNHRFNTVRLFKQGTYRFIIATDLVSRGIDIAEVTHVVNFDIPNQPEDYIHRTGRTGRADKKGVAISFIVAMEKEYFNKIEHYIKITIPVLPLPADLLLSSELTDDEQPKVFMKEIQLKVPPKTARGASFHEKSARNSKQNKRTSRKDQMKKKYGKPITRRGKR